MFAGPVYTEFEIFGGFTVAVVFEILLTYIHIPYAYLADDEFDNVVIAGCAVVKYKNFVNLVAEFV
jgi:hypothetical protein